MSSFLNISADKISEVTMKKYFSYIPLLLALVIVSHYVLREYHQLQTKARMKEGLTLLNSFRVALEATKTEAEEYPGEETSLDEVIGFHPAGKIHYHIAHSDDSLSRTLRDYVPKSFEPFIKKDRYRILASVKMDEKQIHLCKVESWNKKMECLLVHLGHPQ